MVHKLTVILPSLKRPIFGLSRQTSTLNLSTTAISPQRQRPLKRVRNDDQLINDWRTVYAKPNFFIVKCQQTLSIPHVTGLCFCLVSVLLIMLIVLHTAYMLKYALFKKRTCCTMKKERCHVTPLPPHSGHFPLSPWWPLQRGPTASKFHLSFPIIFGNFCKVPRSAANPRSISFKMETNGNKTNKTQALFKMGWSGKGSDPR